MSTEPKPWTRRALLAVAVLPIVAAVVRALMHHWFPIGDNALLYVRVADVLTDHHPWLGSWTSASLSVGENMNNPGPIYADLIAPFAKVFSPGPGAAIGVGTVNALSIVAISSAGRRLGGWAFQRWALLAAAALAWSMGSEMLIDIWQAHALLLPFLLLMVLLLGVTDGQTWCIPWALAVITVLVQTHISFAYILAIVCPVAAVSYALVRRRRPHLPLRAALHTRLARFTAAGLFALWAQPLYEQFFGPGKGNLSRLAGNTGGGALQVGAEKALGITARLFALPPWWMRSGFSTSVPNTTLTGTPENPRLEIPGLPGAAISAVLVLTLAGLLAALAVHHRRRGAHLLAAACVVAVASVVGSALAVSQLTVGRVGFSSHHVRFLWPLALFVHVALGWSLVDRLARRQRVERTVPWALGGATVLLSVAAVPYCAQPQGPVAFYSSMPILRRVMPQLEKLRDVQPVLYDVSQVRIFEPFSSTVMMRLQELGIEFRVDDEVMVRQLGEERRADGTEKARIFQIQGSPVLLGYDEFCLIASASEVSASAERVAIEYADRMAHEVADGTITIEESVLRGDDAAIEPVMRAAIAGDFSAAQHIVYEGYLSRWYASGEALSLRDLSQEFPLVDHFMNTVYGLFSDQTEPCP
ncbi:MAG: hypothetical protein WCC60_08710 [Ilumatobacteraceae bacterium]